MGGDAQAIPFGKNRRPLGRRLRDAVAEMQAGDDIQILLATLADELEDLGIRFSACGINFVDLPGQQVAASINRFAGSSGWCPSSDKQAAARIEAFWRGGVPVYRRDLQTDDPYGERERSRKVFGPGIRSVVDIPFAYGTLAVNSDRPNAFSDGELSALGDLAGLLEEALRRRLDLLDLEERNRELEAEVTRRRQAVEALRTEQQLRDAEQAVRLAVASMVVPEDLFRVVTEISAQARRLGVEHDETSLQIVDPSGLDFISVGDHEYTGWQRLVGPCWGEPTRNPELFPWVLPVWRENGVLVQASGAAGSGLEEYAIIDVAFSRGTLALSRRHPGRLEPEQAVPILRRLALVVSEGYQRFTDIVARVRAEQRLHRDLRLEQTLGRIRDEVLRLDDGLELSDHLQGCWADELRGLDLPVHSLSLQLPDPRPGWYRSGGGRLDRVLNQQPLAGCPWVAEAWQEDRPVVVDRARLEACAFGVPEVQALAEVPLPGLQGSLGCSSRVAGAFDEEAVDLLARFAAVLAVALRRIQDAEALRQSEEQHRAILETAIDGFWLADPEGRLLNANQAYARMSGYSRQELLAMRIRDLEASESPAQIEAHLRQVEARGQDRFESRHCRRDGSVFDVEVSVQYRAGEGGRFVAFIRDIGDRRRAEATARTEAGLQRLRNVILQMNTDSDWQEVVIACERELRDLVDFRDCSLGLVDPRGRGVRFYRAGKGRLFPPLDVPEIHPALRQALETRQPVFRPSRQHPLFDPDLPRAIHSIIDVPFDGGTLAFASTREAAFDAADIAVLTRFAKVIPEARRRLQDLDERRRLEGEMVRIQRLHAAAELSAGVSHNLNNILTGVLVPAQLLAGMTDDPDLRQEIDTILLSAERATALVHRLHQSVRPREDEPLRPVAVDPVVQQVLQATQPRWRDAGEARGVALKVQTDLGAPPPLRGTETGLHDLLTNLVLNAVDAMPDGGTMTIRTGTEDGWVRIDFGDTGIGMDEETRARVFEPFFTTKANIGTGLGLSTLHNTVTRWGGRVEVDSAPGQGSTFTLWLPSWSGPVTVVIAADEIAVARRRGRILVIDDDEVVLQVLFQGLSGLHDVEAVVDVEAVLAQLGPDQYDVAIIDLGMPGLSGEQVAQRLAAADPAIARVLFTGWELNEDDSRHEAFDLRLAKPISSLAVLRETVDRAIEVHDRRAPRRRPPGSWR